MSLCFLWSYGFQTSILVPSALYHDYDLLFYCDVLLCDFKLRFFWLSPPTRHQTETMKVAVVFVLLFATVLCRPVRHFCQIKTTPRLKIDKLTENITCFIMPFCHKFHSGPFVFLGEKTFQFRELWGGGKYSKRARWEVVRERMRHPWCFSLPQVRRPKPPALRKQAPVVLKARPPPVQVKYSFFVSIYHFVSLLSSHSFFSLIFPPVSSPYFVLAVMVLL